MLTRGLFALVLVTAFVGGCHHTTGDGNGNQPDEGIGADLGQMHAPRSVGGREMRPGFGDADLGDGLGTDRLLARGVGPVADHCQKAA